MAPSNWETTILSAELITKLQTELKDPAMQKAMYDALLKNGSDLVNYPEIIAMRRKHPDYIEAKAQLRKNTRKKDAEKTAEQLCTANLEAIKYFLSPTPAISSHTLDLKVQGREIYNHLTIYQNKFAEKFANMTDFAEKMKPLDDRMSKIKLDNRPVTGEANVKDRSIVNGNDKWNNHHKWVPDVTYVRNKWYNCTKEREIEIRGIITDLWTEFGLRESEAIQLFVLRMWLGKYGWQDYDGAFGYVGNYVEFAIGPVDGNGHVVPCIYFDDDVAWFSTRSEKCADPQLSN